MDVLEFVVYGTAQPGGSKRAFGYRSKRDGSQRFAITDANPKAKTWKSEVKDAVLAAYDGPPLGGPLGVEFVFYRQRPKGHYGSGKNSHVLKPSAPIAPAVKPDVLKLSRSTEDALTGILWLDDSQIVEESLFKVYCGRDERERLEIKVWEIADSWPWSSAVNLASLIQSDNCGEKLAS